MLSHVRVLLLSDSPWYCIYSYPMNNTRFKNGRIRTFIGVLTFDTCEQYEKWDVNKKKTGTKMVPPNQAPSKSHCKTLNLRRLNPEILVLVPEQNRTYIIYMYQNWMLDNSMCQNFTPSSAFPIPIPRFLLVRHRGVRSDHEAVPRKPQHNPPHRRSSEGHPTEAPRDGLEGMEFVPPQRLNQKNNLGLRNN